MLSAESKINLRDALVASFNIDELKTLCFDLGLDYENLPSSTKTGKARELIEQVERLDKTNDLIERCSQIRPKTSWNDIVTLSAEGVIQKPQVNTPSEDQKGGGKWWIPILVALIGLIGVIVTAIVTANPDIISGFFPIYPTEAPDLSPSSFTYLVRVLSEGADEEIPNARVTLEISRQTQVSDVSDSDGLARIIIGASLVNQPAKLVVEAEDYELYTKNTDVLEGVLPNEIRLKSEKDISTKTSQPADINTPPPSPTSTATPTSTDTPTPTTAPLIPTSAPLAVSLQCTTHVNQYDDVCMNLSVSQKGTGALQMGSIVNVCGSFNFDDAIDDYEALVVNYVVFHNSEEIEAIRAWNFAPEAEWKESRCENITLERSGSYEVQGWFCLRGGERCAVENWETTERISFSVK